MMTSTGRCSGRWQLALATAAVLTGDPGKVGGDSQEEVELLTGRLLRQPGSIFNHVGRISQ